MGGEAPPEDSDSREAGGKAQANSPAQRGPLLRFLEPRLRAGRSLAPAPLYRGAHLNPRHAGPPLLNWRPAPSLPHPRGSREPTREASQARTASAREATELPAARSGLLTSRPSLLLAPLPGAALKTPPSPQPSSRLAPVQGCPAHTLQPRKRAPARDLRHVRPQAMAGDSAWGRHGCDSQSGHHPREDLPQIPQHMSEKPARARAGSLPARAPGR